MSGWDMSLRWPVTTDMNSAFEKIDEKLSEAGFVHLAKEKTGSVFLRDDTCLIIDTVICTLKDYPYVDYTSYQNELMTRYPRVFRLLVDDTADVSEFFEIY